MVDTTALMVLMKTVAVSLSKANTKIRYSRLLQTPTDVNRTNSDVPIRNVYLRHGDATPMTIVAMDPMKKTVRLIHLGRSVLTISLHAIPTTNAFQEATTVIWNAIVSTVVMKSDAVNFTSLLRYSRSYWVHFLALPVVSKPPPPMVTLEVGSLFEIGCTAVGVPTPEIVWRLNWGHIPPKCRTTSVNGVGTLSCPNIQIEDQGAYSCEVINIKGTVFAIPDTILVIDVNPVCRDGYFNEEARTESECIKCFCFGQSNKCRSADLFIYQFQPPFDSLKLLGVFVDPNTGAVEVRDEPIYRNGQPLLTSVGRNGVYAQLPPYGEISSSSLVPYFAMPENYHGNQLKSYGGYLRFNVQHNNRGYQVAGPTVILTVNYKLV